jgi:hypothetical protein
VGLGLAGSSGSVRVISVLSLAPSVSVSRSGIGANAYSSRSTSIAILVTGGIRRIERIELMLRLQALGGDRDRSGITVTVIEAQPLNVAWLAA